MGRWVAAAVAVGFVLSGCNCGGAPAGFSQVHVQSSSGPDGVQVSLVLDRDDQPLVAYVKEDTSDQANTAIYFTRHDGNAGRWTTPVLVTAGLGELSAGRQIWLARDAKDGRLGIAFQKTEQFCGPANGNRDQTIHVTFSTDQGATWSASERVSEAHYTRNDPVNGVEVCNTRAPRLAMKDGVVHLAWAADAGEPQDPEPLSFYAGYYYASSTAAGTWTRALLPNLGDGARKGVSVLSLALDSAGAPAVAYVLRGLTGYNNTVVYFRPGGTAVTVGDSAGLQNDNPQVALAFDGLKPRVAMKLGRTDTDSGATWLARSDDGAAFTDVRVPDDGQDQGGEYLNLDFVGGKGALVYDFGRGMAGAGGRCGGPKVSRSTDAVTWSTCGADDQTRQFLGVFASARQTQAGKLVVALYAAYPDEASPSRFAKGIVLWREP